MLLLAVISLTTPMMLWGMTLLALPVAAHLLNRRARRRVVFPTIRLLRESAASQSHLFRLRRLILLALRCLLVALIAWAFSRPVWTDVRAASGSSGSGTSVVLIMDVSASTARQTDGVALINSIRSAGQRALDTLKPGVDVANVIYAAAQPHAAFDQMSTNLALLRDEVGEMQPTFERADLKGAIALAGQMLAQQESQRRVIVISDSQASNWSDLLTAGTLDALVPDGTRVTIVDVEAQTPPNIALSDIRCNPARPIAGQPAQASARLTNYADHDVEVRVNCSVDDGSSTSQTVTLRPWEQREVACELAFERDGEHTVAFALPDDALAADNRAHLVIQAARQAPVTLIADDEIDEAGSSSYFLSRALAPRGDQSDQFIVHRLSSVEITPATLSRASVVLVADIGALKPVAASALFEHVNKGGGIAWFCGSGPVGQNLQTFEQEGSAAGAASVLPWMPGTVRDLSASGTALSIGVGEWRSNILKTFDERSQIALAQIGFRRVFITGNTQSDAKVLLTFSDGTPALASRMVGAGRIVLANFSPSLRSSDLARYGAFVALLQSLVNDLQSSEAMRGWAIAGEPYGFDPIAIADGEAPGNIEVFGPDGSPVSAVEVTSERGALRVSVARPEQTGFYSLQRDGKTLAKAAMNVDPRESDLRPIDRAQLAMIGSPDTTASAPETAGGSTVELATLNENDSIIPLLGQPIWHWIMTLACVVLGAELLMLAVWRR